MEQEVAKEEPEPAAPATPAAARASEAAGALLEQFFRLAVEASPIGTIIADRSGEIALVNAQAEKLFGYERAELLGKPVELLVPQRLRGRHPEFRESFWSEPRARPMGAGGDLFGLRKDGAEFPIEIGLTPLQTAGGTYVLSSVVEITERKRAEEQLRISLQEKETLLREVHHRVKNNLQVISSLLSLQSRSVSDPQAAAVLEESQNRVHSISLVHEKLYESGDLARVSFGDYLQALGQHLMVAWTGSEGRVSLDVDARGLRLPLDVAIPCGLIVNELVTNAFKHAYPDGRSGVVVVRAFGEPGGRTWLSVEDDGVGFQQDKARRTGGSRGTMGMALVQTLAKQLNAELAITSTPGTRVQLRFQVSP